MNKHYQSNREKPALPPQGHSKSHTLDFAVYIEAEETNLPVFSCAGFGLIVKLNVGQTVIVLNFIKKTIN